MSTIDVRHEKDKEPVDKIVFSGRKICATHLSKSDRDAYLRISDGVNYAVFVHREDYANFKKALEVAEKEWGLK